MVTKEKVVDYLLSVTHEVGSSKAAFFRRFGFAPDNWEEMAEALAIHAASNEVSITVSNEYGIRYIIYGELKTPDGRNPDITSVWFVEDDEIPRLVTAYPGRSR